MAKYTIAITNRKTDELIDSMYAETQGEAMEKLINYGGSKADEGKDYHYIEWQISRYPMPMAKGSIFQMFGKFTRIWSPIIKGVGYKK